MIACILLCDFRVLFLNDNGTLGVCLPCEPGLYLLDKIFAKIFKIVLDIGGRGSLSAFIILSVVLELTEHLVAVDQADERFETLAFVINLIILAFYHKFLLHLGQDLVAASKQLMLLLILEI